MQAGRGLINYRIDGNPCSEKKYFAARGEHVKMDPFKSRAQVFAKEFKLDDSKFFVNALEAAMRSTHEEALDTVFTDAFNDARQEVLDKQKLPRVKGSVSEFLTDARLKRFRGITKAMHYDSLRSFAWSYQKRCNS